MSDDPATDTRRWHQTARICAPARPPLWPWVIVAGLALWVILRVGCADAAECPTHWQCWRREVACEATPKRAWKPCRVKVAACFRAATRCYGEWTL